jgi:hypothetical protein
MKKSLLSITTLLILLLTVSTPAIKGQVLYEGFDYTIPGYIGGNGNAGTSSNNWTTHSVTSGQTTTLDLYSGNLIYTGLHASSGNKVMIFGNANATSRDVNRAFTTTSTVIYFSALINVVDNSGLTATGDYFMHIAQTSGTTVTVFGGRLGVKTVNDGANYRFMIQNTSSGTPTFTEFGTDMVFGTTYLVVVKYDRSTSPTTATLWVNPSTLGGAEPSGSVSNNSGTGAFSAFASVCLRNNATTPKAEIDEIYVGETFASVTPGPDTNPPSATFNPANSATDVLVNVVPTITFNEAILKTDGSPVTNTDLAGLVSLNETSSSGTAVPFTATIDATKKIVTVTPSSNLKNAQVYYLGIGPVEDVSGNELTTASVTFTTISAVTPTIALTYPNGGEKFYSGDQATITWTTTNFDAAENVKIEVWLPVSQWFTLEASTPNDGSQAVNVGPDADYGTTYLIRVSGATNGVSDESDNPFTVIATATTLADLRTNPANAIVKYKGIATVTYARTSYNQKYIQDATGAVLIHDQTTAPGYITGTYNIGDGITNVEGKITLYNGLIELVPQATTGEPATGTAIVPEVRTLASLTADDQCKLIKVEKLKFNDPFQFDATNGYFVSSKNYDLAGYANTSDVFRTAFSESDYIGTAVPTKYFDAVVLVGQFNAQMQITARNLADFTILSDAKAITSFVFAGLDPDVTGTIDETAKTISLLVPSGTDFSTLVPTIAVSANATVSPLSGVVTDFSSPVVFTVTAQDGTTQTYTATVSTPTGIEKVALSDQIKIYPVPARSVINIKGAANLKSVEILDVTGKVLRTVTTTTSELISIPVSELKGGTYMLRFNTSEGVIVKRFVRQ